MNKYIRLMSLALILITAALTTITPQANAALVWSSEAQLTAGTDWDIEPSAMQARDGKIWVVWTSFNAKTGGQKDIFYKTYDGSSWSGTLDLVKSAQEDEIPSIFQIANGTIYVAWTRSDDYHLGDIYYKKTSNNGASWSPDTQLTTDPDGDYSPAITQTMDGRIWVAWHSYRTGNEEIYYKTYNGTSWSNDTQLTFNSANDRNPAILQARNGIIWVFWTSTRIGGKDEIFYKTSSNNGASWSTDKRLTINPDYNDLRPSVMQTKDGKIWVAWYTHRTATDDDEVYYQYFDGTYWYPYIQVTDNTYRDIESSILQAENSTIWFFWSSYRAAPNDNYDIYYKTASAEHDVAVTAITPTQNPMYQGFGTKVQVKVRNYGLNTETFDVTLKYDTTVIGTQTVTSLARGAVKTLTFSWDNTNIPYGYYTLSATASAVPGEEDLTDNTFTGSSIVVTIPGDVNGDKTIDVADCGVLSAHWYPGPPIGPLDYDVKVDVNYDGAINVLDVGVVNGHWGESW